MDIYSLYSKLVCEGTATILLVMTLIQIVPIRINPWSKLGKLIGSALNKELEEEVRGLQKQVQETSCQLENLSKQMDAFDYKFEEHVALLSRSRILEFADEISHDISHSRERFHQILEDLTVYEKYCSDHPKFKNNMTIVATERIKEDYKKRDLNNNFLL